MTRTRRTMLALLVAQAGACVRFKRYEPAPPPSVGPAAYAGRRLDDSALTRFLDDHGAPPEAAAWDPHRLALAALFFRADAAEARSAADEARAGITTAGGRPPVSVGAAVGRAARPEEGNSSPWTVSLDAGLTFETGGKRAARQARARALALAADLRAAASDWRLVSDAAAAAAAASAADSDFAHVMSASHALGGLRDLLRARFAEGQLSEAEVARAETDVQATALEVAAARRTRTGARLALALAIGVPLRQVQTIVIGPTRATACDALDSLAADSLEARALRTRAEVGAALAEYAAADADLRLEIGRQYPDITLGPSLAWDQGIARWLIALTLPDLALARNRGPIAEAEARRAGRAAHVGAVQDSVSAAVESAVAGCHDARADLGAADSLVRAAARASDIARAAYGRGESGRTEMAFADLARVLAERSHGQALGRRDAAGTALESALGEWITDARTGGQTRPAPPAMPSGAPAEPGRP